MYLNYQNPRLDHASNQETMASGDVYFDPKKIAWLSLIGITGTIGSALTFSWAALALFILFTGFVLLFGHSLGMHRMFIHKAFKTPRWLYLFMIHLGTVVGIAGPMSMLRTHDMRDWAQRQTSCHAYFSHSSVWWRDLLWQVFGTFKLRTPLTFKIEPAIQQDQTLLWIERYWMLQQLPWTVLFYVLGGWGFVCWGISTRVLVSNLGHWLIGYFAHNQGPRHWQVDGAAVQGHNVPWTSLLTMGECWHNNHHAFPYSAKFGLEPRQWDPGWWVIQGLAALGLANNIVVADIDNVRKELIRL